MFQFRFIDSWSLIGNINEDEGKLLWVLLSQNRGSYLPSSLFTLPHIYCFPPPLSPHFNGFRYTATTAFLLFSLHHHLIHSIVFPRHLHQHHHIFIVFFTPAPHWLYCFPPPTPPHFLCFPPPPHFFFLFLIFNTSLFLHFYPLLYFSCSPSSPLSLAFSLLWKRRAWNPQRKALQTLRALSICQNWPAGPWPDHCPTSQFVNEIRFCKEFLLKNVILRAYYLGSDWSGWRVLIKREIIIVTAIVWPVSSDKWKAPSVFSRTNEMKDSEKVIQVHCLNKHQFSSFHL